MTRKEVLDFLGLPESALKRLLAARLLAVRGKGSGQRFDCETVYAAAVLWDRLEPLLPAEKENGDDLE